MSMKLPRPVALLAAPISGCLQLLPVAAQAKDLSTLQKLGEMQRSGILDCYSCCQLSRNPRFPGADVKSAQVLIIGLRCLKGSTK